MKVFSVIGAIIVALCLSLNVQAFVSSPAGASLVTRDVSMMAKHVQPKAAKKAVKNRPKKSRRSDMYRKAPEYNVNPGNFEGAPKEYEVISEP
mmetsp:Transcript_14815/g.19435  ORF Transcript_14815/g.19435 Transcript_14815/m.19435 type:complete len:93 (+) Transcript_14815:94-372(+)